ncbi:JmjC domain-containing protein [Bdellovibrio sp. NC01]|uniref:JmjC domain-containing protein n=1 Tax=Bdellovibrio sp. NC01 TaxID=2220073 RepID=UPI001157526A|nr:cupin domain-containing protein [Bdellovibrio sp. NC01]QDK39339.1 hypothetical protein DOE51_17925 [Bdellovibrio sp. NC01]
MKAYNIFLKDVVLPSSNDLKNHASINESFASRIRHIETNESNFIHSSECSATSTWAFTSVEKEFESVKTACNLLSELLKKRVQCNAYWTPAHQQGLPAHYDLHDVYVIQIEGSKRWKTWMPFRKSATYETLLIDEKENLPNWTSKMPARRLVLRYRDCLYLPTGMPHECIATEEDSFHYSFGIYND